MPIKEEPVRIEFQYEQEGGVTSDGVFDVEYFSEMNDGKEKKYVRVTPHGATEGSIFELDFLVEVVDFLRKKGVIDNSSPLQENVATGTLPLPQIDVSGNISKPQPQAIAIDSPPQALPVSTFSTELTPDIDTPTVKAIDASVGPSVIVSGVAVDNNVIIDRPVVRTKVGANEDPLKSIEDSARQRNAMQKTTKKTIKRRED
jgi:hypothetical protein